LGWEQGWRRTCFATWAEFAFQNGPARPKACGRVPFLRPRRSRQWAIHEASRADDQNKLICLRDPGLNANRIPALFPANRHIVELGKTEDLLKAIRRLCARRGG
jgi:hypothetical protein